MTIIDLNKDSQVATQADLNEAYLQFQNLLTEIRKKELPEHVVVAVNKDISELNSFSRPQKDLKKLAAKKQAAVLALLEKDLKLVPKNYYRNMWLAVGIAAFGIPLGVAFGTSLGNLAYLGLGFPFGLVIGLGVGTGTKLILVPSNNL